MKKYISLLLAVLCLFSFSACGYYKEEDLAVVSWNYAEESGETFSLGKYKISAIHHQTLPNMHHNRGANDDIIFSVINERKFISSVEKDERLLRVDYDMDGKKVYVFFQNGNYYYLKQFSDSYRIKRRGYFLSNSVSYYNFSDDIKYLFPMFDTSIFRYFGNYTLESGINQINLGEGYENKDWDYWKDFYINIGQDYCQINEEQRTVKLKAVIIENGQNKGLTQDFALQLNFAETDGVLTVSVELL